MEAARQRTRHGDERRSPHAPAEDGGDGEAADEYDPWTAWL
jgi:hypothetical protein